MPLTRITENQMPCVGFAFHVTPFGIDKNQKAGPFESIERWQNFTGEKAKRLEAP